ncbi:MAG TPA: T9SS type A sorting domain-containing protein [Bacteroidia bacterium]|nr:T9SS type A sorting domain-containing protein [Bacteroidia bacterium]
MKRIIYLVPAFLICFASCESPEINTDEIALLSKANAEATQIAVQQMVVKNAVAIDSIIPAKQVVIGRDSVIGLIVSLPVVSDTSHLVEAVGLYDQSKQLAEMTGGVESYLKSASEITQKFIDILDGNLEDNTDLVFMIDCTTSMADDIDNVKQGCSRILNHVRTKKNVRIGVVQYRDKADGPVWYQWIPLSTNYDYVKSYINSIVVSGGGLDWPESMYDAACLTLDTMEWREQSKKMMLVLGDAPSLVPPLSRYGLTDVVAKSQEHGVQMNFYPVIISYSPLIESTATTSPATKPLVAKIYPNPSAGEITVELAHEDEYRWEVMDVAGGLISSDEGQTAAIHLNLSGLPNGVYIVRVFEKNGIAVEDKRVVVAH